MLNKDKETSIGIVYDSKRYDITIQVTIRKTETMKNNIINEIANQLPLSDKPITRILKKGTDSKTIILGLKGGVILKEHKTNTPTTLLIIKGNVVYKEKDRQIKLVTFECIDIPVDVIHAVEATNDSICLLIQG